MDNKSFNWRSRVNSFGYAFEGIKHVLVKEPNTLIHALATVVVIAAGFIKGLAPYQWIAICLCVAFVWITEIINTCIELLCDLYCEKKFHPTIKIIKDIAAAAVLIAALVSVIVGIIVFTS
jgi:diacylglycerol kinase (ATP)